MDLIQASVDAWEVCRDFNKEINDVKLQTAMELIQVSLPRKQSFKQKNNDFMSFLPILSTLTFLLCPIAWTKSGV